MVKANETKEVKEVKGLKGYYKVRREGGSVVLTVGRLIPSEWALVQLTVLEQEDGDVILLEVKKVA